MTKKAVTFFRKELDSLSCINEDSLRKLLSFASDIRNLNHFLHESAVSKNASTLSSFNNQDLTESEIHIQTWFKKKVKRTMCSTFSEYKRDILDDLDRCIHFGDTNNLWE